MNENDFIVALQSVLMRAQEDGHSIEWIIERAHLAIQEFEDEYRIANDPMSGSEEGDE